MNTLEAFTIALPYLLMLDRHRWAPTPRNIVDALRVVEREMTAAKCSEDTVVSQWVARRLGAH